MVHQAKRLDKNTFKIVQDSERVEQLRMIKLSKIYKNISHQNNMTSKS